MAYYKKDPERIQAFSRWLRLVAPEKGFDSQRQLAIAAKIDAATISRIWNATQLPDEVTLEKIAHALGVDVSESMRRAGYITGKAAAPSAPDIGETYPLPPQKRLPIIGIVRAGPGGIAFEDPQGFATVDEDAVPAGSTYFYLRVKGDSMSPEIQSGDLALVREQPEVEYGELAVVVVDGEEGTIKRVFHKNGDVFLQASNPAYSRTEKSDNIRIVGKVKKTVREY